MAVSCLINQVRNHIKPMSGCVPATTQEQSYLYGLRGILALSSVLWIFFQLFIPALVTQTPGPTYQKILRIVLSPICWNESLISSFFLALSGRSICIRFLSKSSSSTFAGSIVRRMVRMSIAVGLASGISSAIFKGLGNRFLSDFKNTLPNQSISVPDVADNGLTAINAIFDMFWMVRSYYSQAANNFWPSQTIWNISLMYQQSWTVYFLMVILPFTRPSWHFEFCLLFTLGAFWMRSWGWYDAMALLMADYVINPQLRTQMDEGLPIGKSGRIPHAVPAIAMVIAGLAMKYCWTVFPQYINEELVLSPFLDLSENTITRGEFAAADPYPRVDNWLVIFGLLLLVETTVQIRDLLSAKWLVFLGKRSLSKCI